MSHLLRRAWTVLRTIRVRLTLWYVALLAVILVAFSAFLYASLSHNLHAQLDGVLEAEAQRLVATLDIQNGHPSLPEESDLLPPGAVVALYDRTGTRILATTRQSRRFATGALIQAVQGRTSLETVRLADGTEWRVLTLPVVENGQLIGVLQVARDERGIEIALRQLITLMAIAIPATLLLAVAGGLFLAARALDPIERITRTAAQISAENLERRLDLPGQDELGRLAATFDRMLDRLEAAFQRQRQFTADASHELRTPLALLTSTADVALERPRSAAAYRDIIASMREDAGRMNQLLGELLTLARADAGQELIDHEPLDLATLVSEVVLALQPLARSRGVGLVAVVPASVTIVGDQTRLTQLLMNLVDNGLKYTPSGGTVTVTVERESGQAVLQVADTGNGIAAEHLPHLFERFYRVDKARSRAEGGTGLGLAICRWIVRAHGGEITVASELGQGTTFTVRLPVAAPGAYGRPSPVTAAREIETRNNRFLGSTD